jgi:hypothetical protein
MDDNLYAPPRSHVADFAPRGSMSLYSPRQIYTAAFLSGPLAGAWFLSRNFHLLLRNSDCRRTLIIGVVVTVALFPLLLFLPKNVPNIVIPIAYSYPFYYFAQRRFPADADTGIGFLTGWRSWLKVIGISVAWLALTVMVWAAAWILTAQFLPNFLPK